MASIIGNNQVRGQNTQLNNDATKDRISYRIDKKGIHQEGPGQLEYRKEFNPDDVYSIKSRVRLFKEREQDLNRILKKLNKKDITIGELDDTSYYKHLRAACEAMRELETEQVKFYETVEKTMKEHDISVIRRRQRGQNAQQNNNAKTDVHQCGPGQLEYRKEFNPDDVYSIKSGVRLFKSRDKYLNRALKELNEKHITIDVSGGKNYYKYLKTACHEMGELEREQREFYRRVDSIMEAHGVSVSNVETMVHRGSTGIF